MYTQTKNTGRLDRVLDGFASRTGICLVFSVLLAVFVGVGLYVNSAVSHLEKNHSIFRDHQARNGYVAMSDIQRILLVAQDAAHEGRVSQDNARKFKNASDVLFVRIEAFRRSMTANSSMNSGMAAIKALEEFLTVTDTAVSDGFTDADTLLSELLSKAVIARKTLVLFLDDMRRQADAVLETQSEAVREQKIVILANLLILTVIMLAALLLLRREVLGRRAREKAEKRVEFLAFFDPLTKLPNRSQFQDRLQELLDDDPAAALLYVDLDGFKLVNDTYGHNAGDAVLCHVGQLLGKLAAEYKGFAARLGGDEYAIVVPTDNLVHLAALCQKVLEGVEKPFLFEGESLDIGLSIGIATTTQVASKMTVTLDLLSRVTDFALYASKSAGRRRYTFYNQDLEARFQERRAMLEELPGAIENSDLEVHLQPKVTLEDTRVFGFEALVRWRRDGELVPPNSFILIAEESGLVVDIDHFVLRTATKLIADWNNKTGSSFSVSVNLSALHFTSMRIIEWVQDALWSSLLKPELLTLEITETMEMRDWTQASSIIGGLRKLGCKIAIDDFGTGYSSLAYLRTTSADELKIDRSLILELETSERARLLMSSVLDIARNLEFEVTIEGIETKLQRDIVQKMGAHNGQGYLFSKPQIPEIALAEAMPEKAQMRQISDG